MNVSTRERDLRLRKWLAEGIFHRADGVSLAISHCQMVTMTDGDLLMATSLNQQPQSRKNRT